ncbi:hypothetical protein IFR05_003767 [Cadophora sp. M221]|nr:hypothetical protein IFR05_003767 [Cadophora sp. M221]
MYRINLVPVWYRFLTQVVTLPTIVDEVIPGSGLPSFASLNITSAELFAMPVPSGPGFSKSSFPLAKRSPECLPAAFQCSIPAAVACYNYLNNLGITSCVANGHYTDVGGGTTVCTVNGCRVRIGNTGPSENAASYCRDVAYGVSTVAYLCQTRNDFAGAEQGRIWLGKWRFESVLGNLAPVLVEVAVVAQSVLGRIRDSRKGVDEQLDFIDIKFRRETYKEYNHKAARTPTATPSSPALTPFIAAAPVVLVVERVVVEAEERVRETKVEETLVEETKLSHVDEMLVRAVKTTVEVDESVGVAMETMIEDVAGVGLVWESVKIESMKETAEDKAEPVGIGWKDRDTDGRGESIFFSSVSDGKGGHGHEEDGDEAEWLHCWV